MRPFLKYPLVLLALIFCSFDVSKYCNHKQMEGLKDACYSKLGKFNFLQSFTVDNTMFKYGGEQIEYKHFLSKGNNYLVVLEDMGQGDDKMGVEIYDSGKRLVASSYDKIKNKFYAKILFPCKSTETYLFKFSFVNRKPTCGVGVVGFQTQVKK